MTQEQVEQLAAAMPEAELLANIRTLAGWRGWLVYHTQRSERSEPGFPDLVLVHPKRGRLIFAELKSQRGKVSPAQQRWIDGLGDVAGTGDDAGALEVFVWRPVDWLAGTIQRVLDR